MIEFNYIPNTRPPVTGNATSTRPATPPATETLRYPHGHTEHELVAASAPLSRLPAASGSTRA